MLFRYSRSEHVLWELILFTFSSWKVFMEMFLKDQLEVNMLGRRNVISPFGPLPLGLCELEFLFCYKQWKYLLSSSFPPALYPSQAGNRVCSSSRDSVQLRLLTFRIFLLFLQ